MDKVGQGWNICVVTGRLEAAKSEGLANALLYGDRVLWLPVGLPLVIPQSDTDAWFIKSTQIPEENIEYYRSLIEQIKDRALPIAIPMGFTTDDIPQLLDTFRRVRFLAPDNWEDQTGALLTTYKPLIDIIENTQACIWESGFSSSVRRPKHWNPDEAALILMRALSSVLLPDVSSLPLQDIVELKEKVEDELKPMQGELLRLTEDLREMVKNEFSEEEVAREAENLIKTRVKSVILEADRKIKELLNSRWKRFLKGGIKALILAGGGYLSPSLLEEALKEAAGAVTEAIGENDKKQPLTSAARFVLELREQYKKRYVY